MSPAPNWRAQFRLALSPGTCEAVGGVGLERVDSGVEQAVIVHVGIALPMCLARSA